MRAAVSRIEALEGAIQGFLEENWDHTAAIVKFRRIMDGGRLNDIEYDMKVHFMVDNRRFVPVDYSTPEALRATLLRNFDKYPTGSAFLRKTEDNVCREHLALHSRLLDNVRHIYGVKTHDIDNFVKKAFA
jgi:hypothetical protein